MITNILPPKDAASKIYKAKTDRNIWKVYIVNTYIMNSCSQTSPPN